MKTKKIMAVLLTLLIVATAFISTTMVSAATATISYSFSGNNSADPGYAQGTITLTAPTGTYYLYWADDEKALDGYTEIAKLTVSSSSATYDTFAQTAIPANATKLIAIKSTSTPTNKTVANASAVYTIPSDKRLSTEKQYSFAVYSDIHIDSTNNAYKYCQEHWSSALQTAADRNVDFIVTAGDHAHSEGGSSSKQAKEWQIYSKILAESDYCNPIYEAIGNHDVWPGYEVGTKNFINATGLDGSNNTATDAYFEKTINGDHFIFMSLEGGFYPDRVEEFSTEQLDWLEGLLKKYSGDGKNIYIIEHSLFYKYGAGDRTDGTPYYDIPLSDDQASTRRFKALLEEYKDTIFISGHTHIAFSEQYNYSDNNGTSGQMLHDGSVGGVRNIVNGSLSHSYTLDKTEGFIVDVYGDGIIFNGANVYYNEYDPNCCYLVRTSDECYQNMSSTEATTRATTATSASTATESSPIQTGDATNIMLQGTFNGWSTANPFYTTDDANVVSTSLSLSAGTYEFKIHDTDLGDSGWYGNSGSFTDTTKTTSQNGWVMSTSDGNCKITATGGYYTFTFNLTNNKMNVLYSATVPTTASSEATEPTTATETTPVYTLGDVNEDGDINILDATTVQRSVANIITLSKSQQLAADVNGDGEVSIVDATKIQQYIASIITTFTSANSKSVYSVGADISAEVKDNLALYYRYSSYDCYQALKKAYRNNADNATLQQLQDELLKVVDPTNVDGAVKTYNVYFENIKDWSKVYAYCWGTSSEKAWPGTEMTATTEVTGTHGKTVYKYTVNAAEYDNIIFSDGNGQQTVDIALTDNNLCYYVTSSSSKFTVDSYSVK